MILCSFGVRVVIVSLGFYILLRNREPHFIARYPYQKNPNCLKDDKANVPDLVLLKCLSLQTRIIYFFHFQNFHFPSFPSVKIYVIFSHLVDSSSDKITISSSSRSKARFPFSVFFRFIFSKSLSTIWLISSWSFTFLMVFWLLK